MNYKDQRKEIRRLERQFRRSQNQNQNQNNNFAGSENAAKENTMSLEQNLKRILPSYMMPTNVGDVNSVSWPFHHVVNFDLGDNATVGPNTRVTDSFQVSQEAAFIITKMSVKTHSDGIEMAPLTIRMIDRQSSRQFNDGAIPLQMIGSKSYPSIFPTPMLIMPNAFMDFTLESWVAANQAVVGSGKIQLMLEGYRIRLGDMTKVLSTIFG